jgi:hypothetical protein
MGFFASLRWFAAASHFTSCDVIVIESVFHVFVIDDLIAVPGDNDYALHLSVPHDGRRERLDAIFVECSKLLRIAGLEIPCHNLVDFFYGYWLPVIHGESLRQLEDQTL